MVIGVITVALRLFICGREFAAVPEISTVIYSRSEGGDDPTSNIIRLVHIGGMQWLFRGLSPLESPLQ